MCAEEGLRRLRVPPARREGQDRAVYPARGARYSRLRRRASRGRPPGVREWRERGGREPPPSGRQDTGHGRGSGAYRGGRRNLGAAEETQPAVPERIRHGGDSPARRGQRLRARGRTEQRHPEGVQPRPARERGRVLGEVGQAEC